MVDEPVRCGCGGEASVKKHTFYRALPLYSVKCDRCGIQVPSRNTEAEAVQVWNKAMGATDKNVGDKFDKDTNVLCKERTAKVEKVDMPSEHNKVYKCCECGQYTHRTSWSSPVNYCTNCGARLEWK